MPSPYEQKPLRTRNALRLLVLAPGPLEDPDIHISIYCTNLEASKSSFEAVSYTWGAESPRKSVQCGGNGWDQQLDVTFNCYSALRHLRHLSYVDEMIDSKENGVDLPPPAESVVHSLEMIVQCP
jgi:hypothetical protein